MLLTFNSPEFKVDYPSTWEIAPKNSTFPYYDSNTIVVLKPVGETNPLNITYLNISPLRIGISFDNTTQTVSPDTLEDIVAKEIFQFAKIFFSCCGFCTMQNFHAIACPRPF